MNNFINSCWNLNVFGCSGSNFNFGSYTLLIGMFLNIFTEFLKVFLSDTAEGFSPISKGKLSKMSGFFGFWENVQQHTDFVRKSGLSICFPRVSRWFLIFHFFISSGKMMGKWSKMINLTWQKLGVTYHFPFNLDHFPSIFDLFLVSISDQFPIVSYCFWKKFVDHFWSFSDIFVQFPGYHFWTILIVFFIFLNTFSVVRFWMFPTIFQHFPASWCLRGHSHPWQKINN